MAVQLPRVAHAVPKALTVDRALAVVRDNPFNDVDWVAARDTAVLTLLYGSGLQTGGLRISEALSLSVKDAPTGDRDVLRVIGKGGKILGVSIVGAQAGELIQPWVLAMSSGLKIKALASMVAPYPTLGEINRRAAVSYYSGFTSSPYVRGALRLLGKLG